MTTRRDILRAGVGVLAIAGCAKRVHDSGEAEVTPTEDLMREHGVLRRALGVLEACAARIDDAPHAALGGAADLIRRFVEDYHEQLEEVHLFPRFQRAGMHAQLIDTLIVQHRAGRAQTEILLAAARAKLADDASRARARTAIAAFVRMYRPHAAREDTELFPDLRTITSAAELDVLGDMFENVERDRFGARGFESIVGHIADLERGLGIYDLAAFTPTATS